MDIGELIDRRIQEVLRRRLLEPELGEITAAGLQLDTFKHPVPTWWGPSGVSIPIGAKVVAWPLKGGAEFYVEPATRQGVT